MFDAPVPVITNEGTVAASIRPDGRYTTLVGPVIVAPVIVARLSRTTLVELSTCQPFCQLPALGDKVTFPLRAIASLLALFKLENNSEAALFALRMAMMFEKEGAARAASMDTILMTINASISVNPATRRVFICKHQR